jgi:hypothetical protein
VIWIAQFSQSLHFGLYEDVWAFIGQPMGWSWARTLEWAVGSIQSWWLQGRPIGFAATAVITFIANRVGGLEGVYITAFLLHVVNAFLVFMIVRRKLSTASSLCAALGFALLPSDTSIPLLTNGLFTGLATLFLLTSIWLYLRGARALAYVVSLCSLLTFESAFLPFFAVPLLGSWEGRLHRRLLKHWAILLMIGGSIFWLRARMGEAKTSAVLGSGLADTLQRIAIATSVGPLTTLRLAIARLGTVFGAGDRELITILAVLAVGLTATLYFSRISTSDTLETWPLSLKLGRYRLQLTIGVDEATATALQLGVCGVVMLIMAYGLAISSDTYPPVIEAGRLSGCTHMAAATGFGLLLGAVSALLLDFAAIRRMKLWAALIIACYFSGLVGFHCLVQRDFVASWHIQQAFWRSVVKECPDLTDGTVLIYEDYSHPLRYVETNSWADPYVLKEVYAFPKSWKEPPQLFPVTPNWASDVREQGADLILNRPFGAWPDHVLINGKVILLKAQGNGVRRVIGTITIKSHELKLKPPQNVSTYQDEHGPLYSYVMQRE